MVVEYNVGRAQDDNVRAQYIPFWAGKHWPAWTMDKPVSSARRSTRIRNAAESDAEADFQAFVAPSPRPLSEKALGKRPQATPRIPTPSVAPLPPSAPDAAARKATRVLPSRSSRKSQGTLMVDELLLDYEQRSGMLFHSSPASPHCLMTPPLREQRRPSRPSHRARRFFSQRTRRSSPLLGTLTTPPSPNMHLQGPYGLPCPPSSLMSLTLSSSPLQLLSEVVCACARQMMCVARYPLLLKLYPNSRIALGSSRYL